MKKVSIGDKIITEILNRGEFKMKKISISVLFGILFTITMIYIPTSLEINFGGLVTAISGYGVFFSVFTLCISYVFYRLVFAGKYKLKFNAHVAWTSRFFSDCFAFRKVLCT